MANETEVARALEERGDMAAARARATALLAQTPPASTQEQNGARDLLARQRFPPVAWWLGGLAAVLFVAMVLLAHFRGTGS